MDPLSITLAIALGIAVFAFGVFVGSLVSSYRFRKKAELASIQTGMRPTVATADRPIEEKPALPVREPRTVAPMPEVMPEVSAPGAASETSAVQMPAVAPDGAQTAPAASDAAVATDGGLELLLAEVADATGGSETAPEPASMPALIEEPAPSWDVVPASDDVPKVVWDIPDELTDEPAVAEQIAPFPESASEREEEVAVEHEPFGDLAWDLGSEALPPLELEAGAGLSWEPSAEPEPMLEPAPGIDGEALGELEEAESPTPAELSWNLEPESVVAAIDEVAPQADLGSPVEATLGAESAPAIALSWEVAAEALPTFDTAPASESGFEPVVPAESEMPAQPEPSAEVTTTSEFTWDIPGELRSDDVMEPQEETGVEPGLTWVIEPEPDLPPLLEVPGDSEAAGGDAGVAEEPEPAPEPEVAPSWLPEPAAPATAAPEWPTVVEPASVQGAIPEPDFGWPLPETTPAIDSDAQFGGSAVQETPASPVESAEPAQPEPPTGFGQPVEPEGVGFSRPRAHVSAIPEGPDEVSPEAAAAPRETPSMPHMTPESIDMVAPVQMWFGDYAVAVKAGSKTHAQFRKYADVLLAELRDASERNR